MGNRRAALLVLPVLVVVLVAGGCSSSDGDAGTATTTSTPTSTSTSTSGSSTSGGGADETTTTTLPGAGEACEPGDCPLKVAGARNGLVIGTALKFGDEREALELREFSGVTAESQLLFSVVHPQRDTWDLSGSDQVVQFADEHDLDLTATHLVWDPPSLPSVLPPWIRAIEDPDELRAALREHLTALHDRYGGKIDRWNVVNEPLDVTGALDPAGHYLQVLGPGYVAEAFDLAEEIWPEAQLVLNENLTEYFPAKADALVALVQQLLDDGVRVDRVGLQSHLFLGQPRFDLAQETMERITALGVPVDITELDIPLVDVNGGNPIDLDVQAGWGRSLVEACLAVERCESITFWGFDDGDTWLTDFIGPGTKPLPWDEDLQPKPFHREVLAALLAGRPG